MEMTLVEKIMGGYSGREVEISPDICMINDEKGHKVLEMVDSANKILKKENVVVILDHDIPAGSFDSAANQKRLIDFARQYDINFIQSEGIGYQIIFDRLVKEGQIAVSCGKHNSFFGAKGALGLNLTVEEVAKLLVEGKISCKVPETINVILKGKMSEGVYAEDVAFYLIKIAEDKEFEGKAIEFSGEAIDRLNMNDKITLCSMASQTGAVTGMINEKASEEYRLKIEIDLSEIKPSVVLPGDLKESRYIEEVENIPISAGFIGGCIGGRIEGLRKAAEILNGKRIKLGVRLLIGFASNEVFLKAVEEGLIDIFIDSGAQVTNPGCASCQTTSIGVVGDGEAMISTGSYNYPGCCGTENSKVYLASAERVAKAALSGYINKK